MGRAKKVNKTHLIGIGNRRKRILILPTNLNLDP
jgi:hypothetical protein